MKPNLVMTIAIMALFGANQTFAEVTINEVSLKHQDVSRLDGGGLYNNLCAACHGAAGKGDGPAATALEKGVPDLTLLSLSNGGTFPHKNVESMIRGRSRATEHGIIDMPSWEQQIMALRGGGTGFPQKAYARNRIHALATHIESLQANGMGEVRVAKVD